VTARDPWVELPARIVGPSLTAAGLAAWALSKNDRAEEAAATTELQDALEDALRSGTVGDIRVSRETVEHAASLWDTAATLLGDWSRSADGDHDASREAARLRARAASLRQALHAD